MSLFWRVFTANAALLIAAALVLGVTPVTVSWPIAVTEAVVLGLGLAGMLAVNAMLLRLAFAPLTALATLMSQVDLLDHPRPLEAGGRGEIAALVAAFNDMLTRLEAERRDSTGRAVAAQEAERRRVATELHDEVGQSMTGVLMQLERLHDGVADHCRDELLDVQDAVRATRGRRRPDRSRAAPQPARPPRTGQRPDRTVPNVRAPYRYPRRLPAGPVPAGVGP
jgi:two-component system sensor histidine kinase UhpB